MKINCQLKTSSDFGMSKIKDNSESEVCTLKQEENQPQNPSFWESVCEILQQRKTKAKYSVST